MNEHDIAEQAYKNGYEAGKRDAEKRLIDANRGGVGIKSTNSNYTLAFDHGLIDVMDRTGNIVCTFNAKDIPTADAVEVVHGRR